MRNLLLLLFLTGCASAGPVVSNISFEAGNNLVIEKCKVHSNFFLGTMQLEDCNTSCKMGWFSMER